MFMRAEDLGDGDAANAALSGSGTTQVQRKRHVPTVPESSHMKRNRFIDEAFKPRHNSLNFLRIVLATAVIFSHASQLSKPGSESIADKTTIGTVAVYGFFAIS